MAVGNQSRERDFLRSLSAISQSENFERIVEKFYLNPDPAKGVGFADFSRTFGSTPRRPLRRGEKNNTENKREILCL
jgi:hypothetical protein